jgi:hypothetical protein
MKFDINMHSLARISVNSRERVNANFPDQVILDPETKKPIIDEEWHEVPYGVAVALRDLDARISALEKVEKVAVIKPMKAPTGAKRRVVKE